MSAKTARLASILSLSLAALLPGIAGAADQPQHQPAMQAASCVSDLFPNASLLPADFCQRSAADRLRILQELADETEIAAPAAKAQIEVYNAKKKTDGATPGAPAGVVPTGGRADVKTDEKPASPTVAAPAGMPIINRIHARDGELVAEAFIPGVGLRRLRKDSPLPDNWRVYSISADQVVIINNDDPKKSLVPLPSSAPMPTVAGRQQAATNQPAALPSLDAELQRTPAPAPVQQVPQ